MIDFGWINWTVTAPAFTRSHAHQGIDVRQALQAVPMGRRPLGRRFQSLVGRTHADEILRIRIEKVRQLLHSNGLPIADIAKTCRTSDARG